MADRIYRRLTHKDRLAAIAAAFAILGLSTAVWHIVSRVQADITRRNIAEHVVLYKATLQHTVDRFSFLPHVLSRDPRISALLKDPYNPSLVDETNRVLEDFAAASGAGVLYVLDMRGVTIASSNWKEELSFVGRDYAFRPYFIDALAQGWGRFYGVGVTTGEAGYFLSAKVGSVEGPLGVVTVKISLAALEREWQAANEAVLLSDENGIVILSSRPNWTYRAFQAVSPTIQQRARETHQYGGANLARPALFSSAAGWGGVLSTPAYGTVTPYLKAEQKLAGHGWTVAVLSDFAEIRKEAWLAATVAALGLTVLLLMSIVWAQRRADIRSKLRAHDLLEQRVSERTRDLVTANEKLALEIEQRRLAEAHLRQTQDELIHAGKLAALGDMSAAISHEINQPLAALRTYLASTVKLAAQNQREVVVENIGRMTALLVRIADITTHLRRFARFERSETGTCEVRAVVTNVLELINARVESEGVTLVLSQPPTPILAVATSGRLEQVLVNLLNNALDAVRNSAVRRIDLQIAATDTQVTVEIEDTGCGIPPEHQQLVFAPYFTTKEVGAGLGLGLSISHTIITSFGGDLRARAAAAGGGARFTVVLKPAQLESFVPLEAAE